MNQVLTGGLDNNSPKILYNSIMRNLIFTLNFYQTIIKRVIFIKKIIFLE